MNNATQIGAAGQYLVCADLILKGFNAYPAGEALPYDVVMEYKNRLLKVQVKTTAGLLKILQRKNPQQSYIFNIRRCGKYNKKLRTFQDCDLFALVALDCKVVGYLANTNIKITMNFRSRQISYRVKNAGKFLDDLTLDKCLNSLKNAD